MTKTAWIGLGETNEQSSTDFCVQRCIWKLYIIGIQINKIFYRFSIIEVPKCLNPAELDLGKKTSNLCQIPADFRVQRCVWKLFIIEILVWKFLRVSVELKSQNT
jgi:hypothetical protein